MTLLYMFMVNFPSYADSGFEFSSAKNFKLLKSDVLWLNANNYSRFFQYYCFKGLIMRFSELT